LFPSVRFVSVSRAAFVTSSAILGKLSTSKEIAYVEGITGATDAGNGKHHRSSHTMQRMRSEQNLIMATLAGGAAALIGGCAWAAITVITNYQIGWMAVGIGFLVGYAVKTFGKGIDRSFGIVGAVWSLAGCAAGNLLTVVGTIAKQQNIPVMNILEKLDAEIIASLMQATFNPMDVLFYGIAVYEGYRFSFRQITQTDLTKIG